MRQNTYRLIAILACAVALVCGEAVAGDGEGNLLDLSGTASLKYRGRWGGGDRDQDLYEHLSLDWRKKEAISAHLSARASEDLDGDQDERGFFAFDGITDTFSRSTNARLYEGYVKLKGMGGTGEIRAGRQYLRETPDVLHMDGALLETVEYRQWWHAKAGVYGGIPVHLYESSAEDDGMMGLWVEGKPIGGTRGRFDWVHIRDNAWFGSERNDLASLSVWQRVSQNVEAYGTISRLEGETKDFRLRATGYCPEHDLQIQLSFYRLMETQKLYVTEFNPFYFSAAWEYSPYWQGQMLVSKGFGEHVGVEAGWEIRRMEDEEDEGEFNREYRRLYLTPRVMNWPVKGMTISLTDEVWDVSEGSDGDSSSYGGDITQEWSGQVKTSVGTTYARYKYDYYDVAERDKVRSYYVKIAVKPTKRLKAELGYEWEKDDYERYRVLNVGMSVHF